MSITSARQKQAPVSVPAAPQPSTGRGQATPPTTQPRPSAVANSAAADLAQTRAADRRQRALRMMQMGGALEELPTSEGATGSSHSPESSSRASGVRQVAFGDPGDRRDAAISRMMQHLDSGHRTEETFERISRAYSQLPPQLLERMANAGVSFLSEHQGTPAAIAGEGASEHLTLEGNPDQMTSGMAHGNYNAVHRTIRIRDGHWGPHTILHETGHAWDHLVNGGPARSLHENMRPRARAAAIEQNHDTWSAAMNRSTDANAALDAVIDAYFLSDALPERSAARAKQALVVAANRDGDSFTQSQILDVSNSHGLSPERRRNLMRAEVFAEVFAAKFHPNSVVRESESLRSHEGAIAVVEDSIRQRRQPTSRGGAR